jgi:hypothetical protein
MQQYIIKKQIKELKMNDKVQFINVNGKEVFSIIISSMKKHDRLESMVSSSDTQDHSLLGRVFTIVGCHRNDDLSIATVIIDVEFDFHEEIKNVAGSSDYDIEISDGNIRVQTNNTVYYAPSLIEYDNLMEDIQSICDHSANTDEDLENLISIKEISQGWTSDN